MNDQADQLVAAAGAMASGERIVAVTGAGISAESGVPTFRDAQTGLWATFNPQELATPDAFRRNPKLVWDWYALRAAQLGEVQPNPGHLALRDLEKLFPSVIITTQNVDGLHQRAGSSEVIALHGDITRYQCFADCQGRPTPIDLTALPTWDATAGPPRCPHCGAFVRPAVVWFGEMLPPGALEAAETACRHADTILVIGTAGEVYPAAALPFLNPRARCVEINLAETSISHRMHYRLRGPASAVLPQLVDAVRRLRHP